MNIKEKNIIYRDIEEEMKSSYTTYAMSVIISRALPDIRDGLKPSQRRILVAMKDLSLDPGKKHRKCAKICGDTSGNYHPHGEAVVYPTLVRMAQDFNIRHPLVDGQGNFGSIDGDAPAAMRYTEARLSHIAMSILQDMDKDTVDFVPNYDETMEEPTVLPGKFPCLLCNGASGIAVGMATNIPPHNLREVVDSLTSLIDNPEMTIKEIMKILKAPDFPTGAIICGRKGVRDMYEKGRGSIRLRAKAIIEEAPNKREAIVVTEIPYQVNKKNLIESMADLVRDKKISGVSDLRDESDRTGMRIVIELKRDEKPQIVLNQLYKHTQLSTTFGAIMLSLVDRRPKILNIKEMLQEYVNYRFEVVTRRTKFELDKTEKRAHILEGLKKALDHIDEIIAVIKKSKNTAEAKENLIKTFKFSALQAVAILEMQLQRLTGLERQKLEGEYKELLKKIEWLNSLLASKVKLYALIKDELKELKDKHGDDRQTEVMAEVEDIDIEDLIREEDMVITITHNGYIKRLPLTTYRKQQRGGKGVSGIKTRDDDFAEHIFIGSTHSYLLIFTRDGTLFWLKVHELPEGSRTSRGKAIRGLLDIGAKQKIAAIIPIKSFDPKEYIVMVTEKGIVKKTSLDAFRRPRKNGILAMKVEKSDRLINVKITNGKHKIILGTWEGKALCFEESDVREMGRAARGVAGMRLGKGDRIIGMEVIDNNPTILTICENGYGKRTNFDEYRVQRRGGKGIINIKTTSRNGHVVGFMKVNEKDEIIQGTQTGMIVRLSVKDVRAIGRNTQGVRLVRVKEGDKVVSVAQVAAKD